MYAAKMKKKEKKKMPAVEHTHKIEKQEKVEDR